MKPSPTPQPEGEPDHAWASASQYPDGQRPPLSESAGDPTDPVADVDTQPTTAVTNGPERPPASASVSQGKHVRRRADTRLTIDQIETQRLPGAPVAVSATPAGPSVHPQRTAPPAQRRHKRARRRATQMPPWVMRIALLLGLIVLGVRAGIASAAFMAPGGDILGWSRLPVVQCVLCHLPQPTTTQKPLTPEQYAAALLPHLTLDQKLGQMMIVQFAGLQPTPDAVQMINTQGAGGVLLFEPNISSASQIEALTSQLKQLSPIPLITAVDQEGGTVNRLINIVGPLPSASSLQTSQAAETRGTMDAALLNQFGFNLDLAPVVDVGTANPQLYERTFGSDPESVATLAGAYLEGLQQSGKVTGTLKHFPGLGDTTTDPHIGLPILSRSEAEWESIDLEPYRVLLKSEDVRAIMVTHELVPAVDANLPASLSPTLINGILRRELGYNNVVITDSLYMGALNTRWSVPQAAVLAIEAGADMVIGPSDPQTTQQVIDALKQAIASGTLSQADIDTAVIRILALKIRMGLIPLPTH
ncbi:MAG TPA: glycoside hydrolase family 3 N-terminal domain-containing protein [Ktedonobacterales bacterium]|nr:glycoside hydrolase family 3 N-terminal domain-containing protein [Ktedonobacterales bacterium]